jgi:GNAT superfamily N-acetyltransferase
LIRGHLPQTLLDPKFNIFGVGVIDAGGSIAGLSAWEITETNGKFVWVNHVLGVHTDFQRQRIGYDLKSEVLARARSAGAIAVTSVVHDANKPMLDLNRKLGATTEPDSERKHTLCTIALRPG